jgi:Carboxypeptidase regulatory-like domain
VQGNSPFRNSAQDPTAAVRALKTLLPRSVVSALRNHRHVPRWRALLALVLCCLLAPAQVYKVDPHKTITFPVDGATAAYTLDEFFAEATAENGVVTVEGKVAGDTHVVVVSPSGTQTFEILVNLMPPVYPPGYVPPTTGAEQAQSGYYEGRYYSNPAEIQNQIDFMKINGDNWTHINVVETNLVGADQDLPRVALSSLTYEIATADRDITLFDKYLDESQLTINGSIVRGLHLREGNWFGHVGYTSVETFDGLFLPVQPEFVAGGGYRYPFTENSWITGSFYQVQVHASDRLGRSGSIGDVRYEYKPRENFWFNADLGIGRGIAGSGRLHYISDRDTMLGTARYMPVEFASLGANNLRGLLTDLSWTRHVTKKFETDLAFYKSNLVLPDVKEATISGSANLRYQLTRHWALTGGALASEYENELPPGPAIRNFTLPAGLAFQSKHFGLNGQYQFSVTPGQDSGAKQFRANLHTGWGGFNFNAYAEQDANAPTLSFIFGQVTGLQQVLEQQGIQATSIQQVDELLSSDAYLMAAGFIKGATINVVPVRTLLGGTADWSTKGAHKRDLAYTFQYNENQSLQGTTEDVVHTLAFTQQLSRLDHVSMSCSILALKNPGSPQEFSPACFIAYRHQFEHVPYFIIPERRGTLTGNVFRDDQSKGELEPGMPPMPEVEVVLDDLRRTLTGVDGSYRFPNVHRGKHKLEAIYTSKDPFFFTTPSSLEVDEDDTTNFGIGYSLSGLTGKVLNDAGQGVAGVSVTIGSRGKKWSATTAEDGSFFVSSLVAGDYDVQADPDSLPAGYSADGFGDAQKVAVGKAAPGKAAFTARAYRSIAGQVTSFDTKQTRYVAVIGAQVNLREPGLSARTDRLGRYLFRDLAAGSYTISIQNDAQTPARTVRLGSQPIDLTNVDFQIKPIDTPDVPAPKALPSPAPTPAPAPLLPQAETPGPAARPAPAAGPVNSGSDSTPGAAQQHNILGRQLTKAGRYREAIVELTEALRIAPDFTLALNARGFVLVLLHEWARAIEDLDRAIRINPKYANAYRIRAAARKSLGDEAGAAADLRKARQLAQ